MIGAIEFALLFGLWYASALWLYVRAVTMAADLDRGTYIVCCIVSVVGPVPALIVFTLMWLVESDWSSKVVVKRRI